MKTVLSIRVWLMSLVLVAGGSKATQAQDPLERYLAEGLQQNNVIQQKHISLDKALLALQTAKSMYLPVVAFQAAYQTGDGGRDIPLPLGDLLNNVYSTLNQLTNSQQFPQLENQSVNFFPRNFYDAKIRTSMPLFNRDIAYNKQISERQVTLQEYELETYRRELVKDIKTAYFNYLSAMQLVQIRESALVLAKEGKRVNERLLESGKGLPAYVLRADSEIAAAEAQLTKARQQAMDARLYFNMLLNREGDAGIDTTFDHHKALNDVQVQLGDRPSPADREELKSLREYISLNETVLKMNKQFRLPKLNGFVDIGSQAEGFRFNQHSRYYLAGLQLDIPLFSGNRNRLKIKETELGLLDAQLNLEQVQRQLQLSSNVAMNNLRSAWDSYQSSVTQLRAAESYQRLIERGYQAGAHTYIETIDARNQLTAARMATTINSYQVLQAAAGLERETAAYIFPINQ